MKSKLFMYFIVIWPPYAQYSFNVNLSYTILSYVILKEKFSVMLLRILGFYETQSYVIILPQIDTFSQFHQHICVHLLCKSALCAAFL